MRNNNRIKIFKETVKSSRKDAKTQRKSRRDGTLLTVGFNLRTGNATHCAQVPQGRHFGRVMKCLPCGTWQGGWRTFASVS